MPRVLLVMAILAAAAGTSLAQMHGGGGQHMMGPGMMGPGMTDNMGMMAHMMDQMHQMLGQGQMSPEAQQQMLETMRRMGQIMQEMQTPQGQSRQDQYRKELQGMQQRLETLQRQSQHQH